MTSDKEKSIPKSLRPKESKRRVFTSCKDSGKPEWLRSFVGWFKIDIGRLSQLSLSHHRAYRLSRGLYLLAVEHARYTTDSPFFKPLVDATAKNFVMQDFRRQGLSASQ